MTPGQDSVIASMARRMDDLTKRVQELEAARLHADDRAVQTAERHYRALGRDTEAPGKALGVDMTYAKPTHNADVETLRREAMQQKRTVTIEDVSDPDGMDH